MKEKLITKAAVVQVISDYWAQLKKYPWQSTVAIFSPAIGSIFVFYLPPLIIARIVDGFIKTKTISIESSLGYLALFGFGWFFGELLWRFGIHFLIKIEEKGINVLSRNTFTKLAERDYDFFTDNFVGTLSKRAFSYARNFENVIDTLTFNVSSQGIPILFVIYILWGYSPWIPLLLIGCIVLTILMAVPLIRKRAYIIAERHDANSRMVGRLSDSITNIMAIKSFAKEEIEHQTFGKSVDEYTQKFREAADFQNQRYDTVVSPIYVMTNVIGLAAAIFFAQTLGLQAGAIIVVFSYYSQVTRIFWNINSIYRGIEANISEAAEFTQLFLLPPIIQDIPNATKLTVKDGNVVFNNIAFNYCKVDGDKDCFLNNFSLDLKSKQKVGLVGPSGGGKTTITKLLLRFIDSQSGDIEIDGQKIKEVTQASLREAISYVPQEPLLFHRSLFDNIAYSNEKATKEEVITAAKIAHADEFISKLPEGYDTLVGERGIKLSGGQRQRVAIARALLKKAPILLLDEATSSLDSESEKYIQEGLWELMKDKTAIVIAHRLSTIKHLDRILVLDDGKIVQDGTHDELIKLPGLYKKLWSHQSGQDTLNN
jgi:ATP-binding cassette, subfamily B, bacterial